MAGENPPVVNANQSTSVDQVAIDKLTVGPKAGDFVVVDGKHYTQKEIQDLVTGRSTAEKNVQERQVELDKVKGTFKRIYSNPENPDREALRDALVMAGKSVDEANALIEEELGSADDAKEASPSRRGAQPEQPKQDDWASRAYLNTEFERSAKNAFDEHSTLKNFVDSARKREAGDSKDPKVLEEAEKSANFVRAEITQGITQRAKGILQDRVRKEGMEEFKKAPIQWFNFAVKMAAEQEAGIARRRYGDPNKIGHSPLASQTNPLDQWIETHPAPKNGRLPRYDPAKSKDEQMDEFGDALTRAVLESMKK